MTLTHKFVQNIPEVLEDGVVYVSIPFETVIHKCCCGCGNEVVTPLSPTDWSMTFNGETISLDPSIGNWSFECKSHYFIRRNKVVWARRFSNEEIAEVKYLDKKDKVDFYKKNPKDDFKKNESSIPSEAKATDMKDSKNKLSVWLKRLFK